LPDRYQLEFLLGLVAAGPTHSNIADPAGKVLELSGSHLLIVELGNGQYIIETVILDTGRRPYIDLRDGLAPFLTFGTDEERTVEEIPFTNPFED